MKILPTAYNSGHTAMLRFAELLLHRKCYTPLQKEKNIVGDNKNGEENCLFR
jgi:hypothetical protein